MTVPCSSLGNNCTHRQMVAALVTAAGSLPPEAFASSTFRGSGRARRNAAAVVADFSTPGCLQTWIARDFLVLPLRLAITKRDQADA